MKAEPQVNIKVFKFPHNFSACCAEKKAENRLIKENMIIVKVFFVTAKWLCLQELLLKFFLILGGFSWRCCEHLAWHGSISRRCDCQAHGCWQVGVHWFYRGRTVVFVFYSLHWLVECSLMIMITIIVKYLYQFLVYPFIQLKKYILQWPRFEKKQSRCNWSVDL